MFAIGDKVVRKKVTSDQIRNYTPTPMDYPCPKPGDVLVIRNVITFAHWPDGIYGLEFDRFPSYNGYGWHCDAFEKIVPADESFINMIRNCNPTEKQPTIKEYEYE